MNKTWGALLLTSLAMIGGGCGDSNKKTPDAAGGSGDASAACATDSTKPMVQLGAIMSLTADPSASLFSEAKPMFDLVAAQVNNDCGLLGDATGGVAVAFNVVDDEGMGAIAAQDVTTLTTMPVAGMVAVDGSAPAVAAAPVAVKAHVPLFITTAAADSLTGCAPNTTLTPTLTPMDDATYCFNHGGYAPRFAVPSALSYAQAAVLSHQLWPQNTVAVVLSQDSGPGREGAVFLQSSFTATGGTFAGASFFPTGITQAQMVTQLQTALDTYNPSVFFGSYRLGHLILMLEAYNTLANDPTYTKPSNFANIKFMTVSSVRGDYTPLSVGARTVAANQFAGIEPYFDDTSMGFMKWLAAWQAFNPDATLTDGNHFVPRAYDAAFTLALAIMKAGTTDAATIAYVAPEVAGHLHNQEGELIYPGEWAKARAAILAGQDINYQGATGSCDFDQRWEAADPIFEEWHINMDGTTSHVTTIVGSR